MGGKINILSGTGFRGTGGVAIASGDNDNGSSGNVAFTTGRGSMFGAKPVPSLKLATNTPMYQRLEEDMDINTGAILDGECTLAEMGERIFDLMLRTASGEPSKSELLGLGDNEFVPWQIGIMS